MNKRPLKVLSWIQLVAGLGGLLLLCMSLIYKGYRQASVFLDPNWIMSATLLVYIGLTGLKMILEGKRQMGWMLLFFSLLLVMMMVVLASYL